MNKLMYGALAALLFPLASCQDEEEGGRSGMVDYTISAGLPTVLGTYASNEGGIRNVDPEMYDLKYTMEVWDGERKVYEAEKTVERDFATSKVNFNVRLAAMRYKFVFFAEFINQNTKRSYYVHSNLNDIQLTKHAYGDEAADAYFASEEIDLSQASVAKSVTLKRPFGKIRLLATDMLDGVEVTPSYAVVKYTQEAVPGVFNACIGEAAMTTTVTNEEYRYEIPQKKESFGSGDENAYVVGFDYILPVPEQNNYGFTITIYDSSNRPIGQREVANIPVVANKLTTVYGNFYSNEGDLDISVDDEFAGDIEISQWVVVKSVADINAKLAAYAGNPAEAPQSVGFVASAPLTFSTGNGVSLDGLPDNMTVAFDLKGYTAEEGTLGFNSDSFSGTLMVNNSGNAEGTMVINVPNGSASVSGSFAALDVTTKSNTLVVDKSAVIETLTVHAGNVEIYGTVNNVVRAEGYTGKVLWAAGSAEKLQELLVSDKADGVVLSANIADMTDSDGDNACVRIVKDGFVLDGKGFAISGNAAQNIVVVAADNVEVKNLEIYQPTAGVASNGLTSYCVTGTKITAVTIHDCRKAAMIVNGAEVTASGLHTYGNAWGGVNVSKGSGVTEAPVFTFDGDCNFEEANKVWVDCEKPWTVNAPAGWRSHVVNGVTMFTNEPLEPGTVTNLEELKAALPDLSTNGGTLTIAGDFKIEGLEALEIQKPTILKILGKITCEDENFCILNKSELTIEASGTVDFQRRVVENHGKLTVNGGTYYSHVRGGGTIFWNNNENAEMILNDVTTYATNFAVAGNGKIEINGGMITSDSSNKYGAWAYCVRAQDSCEMIINNATIKGVQGAIACIEFSKVTLNNVRAIAENSEPGRQDAFYALYAASLGVIEVNSGEYYSDRNPCCYASDDDITGNPYGAFVLKGGKYSSMPKNHNGNNWWAEDGYKFVETGDDTYPYEIVKE